MARDSKWEYRRAQPIRQDSLNPNALTPTPDTILIREKEEIVRYRLRCDTIESVKLEVIRDSIPYPVEVEVIKEVTRKRTWLDTLSYYALGILAGLVGIKLTKLIKF